MAPSSGLGRLSDADAFHDPGAVILDPWNAQSDQRLHCAGAGALRVLERAHRQGAMGAARLAWRPAPVLHAAEVGEHVAPSPARIPRPGPAVVVLRQAAPVDHPVD